MKRRVLICSIVLVIAAGCAIGDVPGGNARATPPPPLTLEAPPTTVFAGDCDNTPELEAWLQASTLFVSEFQTRINAIATQNRAEMYENVVYLAAVRDAAHGTVTPGCAGPLHQLTLDMMDRSVDTLQAYVNGDTDDLGTLIPDTISTIDQIIASQNELIARLEAQFQAQRSTPDA